MITKDNVEMEPIIILTSFISIKTSEYRLLLLKIFRKSFYSFRSLHPYLLVCKCVHQHSFLPYLPPSLPFITNNVYCSVTDYLLLFILNGSIIRLLSLFLFKLKIIYFPSFHIISFTLLVKKENSFSLSRYK